MVSSGTVLIKHKIFDPEKGTTKVAVLELWLVYCVSGIQMCLLSIRQIFHSGLRVEGNKSSFTFCDKSGHAILLTTPNLWSNIQIVRTCILKHNICYNYYLIFNITWTCVRVCSICQSLEWQTLTILSFLFFFFILETQVQGQHDVTVTQQSQDHMTKRKMQKILEEDNVIQYSNDMLVLWTKHGLQDQLSMDHWQKVYKVD